MNSFKNYAKMKGIKHFFYAIKVYENFKTKIIENSRAKMLVYHII